MTDSPFAKAARASLARMRHERNAAAPADQATDPPPDDGGAALPEEPHIEFLRLMELWLQNCPPEKTFEQEETFYEREERLKREEEEFLRGLRDLARRAGEPWSPEVEAKIKARAEAHFADLDREARYRERERALLAEQRDRRRQAASSRSTPPGMNSSEPGSPAAADKASDNWLERGLAMYDTRTSEEKRLDDERNAKARPVRMNSPEPGVRGTAEPRHIPQRFNGPEPGMPRSAPTCDRPDSHQRQRDRGGYER